MRENQRENKRFFPGKPPETAQQPATDADTGDQDATAAAAREPFRAVPAGLWRALPPDTVVIAMLDDSHALVAPFGADIALWIRPCEQTAARWTASPPSPTAVGLRLSHGAIARINEAMADRGVR